MSCLPVSLCFIVINGYLTKGVSYEQSIQKGVLDLCVLSLLHRRDCYGYEISDFLSGHIDVADGTVYPLLRKLKNEGLLTTYLQEESGGPPRKYYKLTDLGRETYQNDKAEYLKFAKAVETLLEEENNDKE